MAMMTIMATTSSTITITIAATAPPERPPPSLGAWVAEVAVVVAENKIQAKNYKERNILLSDYVEILFWSDIKKT